MVWFDLTRPVHHGMAVFTAEGYTDVPVRITGWSTVAGQGFATQKVVLGTQAGTHIDAPAHFVTGGATLDAFGPHLGIGRTVRVRVEDLPGTGAPDAILLLDVRGRPLTDALVRAGGALDPAATPLVVLLGEPVCTGPDPYALNRALARAGVCVVEDLVVDALPEGFTRGRVVVAWPHLIATSGAPCRVLVQMEER